MKKNSDCKIVKEFGRLVYRKWSSVEGVKELKLGKGLFEVADQRVRVCVCVCVRERGKLCFRLCKTTSVNGIGTFLQKSPHPAEYRMCQKMIYVLLNLT